MVENCSPRNKLIQVRPQESSIYREPKQIFHENFYMVRTIFDSVDIRSQSVKLIKKFSMWKPSGFENRILFIAYGLWSMELWSDDFPRSSGIGGMGFLQKGKWWNKTILSSIIFCMNVSFSFSCVNLILIEFCLLLQMS